MTDVEQLADPVWALIDAIPNVDTFDGDFVNANGDPVPVNYDEDDRVHAYAVYYPSAGLRRAVTLDATPDVLDWGFQVTCAGGDRRRALWCVTQVRKALTGAWVTVDGQELQIREDVDPGALRRDDAFSPPRFYLPLLFVVASA